MDDAYLRQGVGHAPQIAGPRNKPGIYEPRKDHDKDRYQPPRNDPAPGKRRKRIVCGGFETVEDAVDARAAMIRRLRPGFASIR